MASLIGDAGLALLREFEVGPDGGAALLPYDAHDGKLTIGWGHVITGDETIDCRQGITADEADALLIWDCELAAHEVDTHVEVPLSANQRDSLICWTFNIGRHGFDTSTALRELDAGDYAAVPDQLRRWVFGGGRRMAGLVRRREAEVALWLSP